MSTSATAEPGATLSGVPPAVSTAATPAKKVKPPRKKPARAGGQKSNSTTTSAGGAETAQQQKQRDKEFLTHKAHIQANLQSSACDLSPKGSVDVKCLPVMELLNTDADYITTSSCSGRIALFHSIGPNDGGAAAVAGGDNEDGDVDPSPTPKSRMKRGDDAAQGWVFVKHGMLRPAEMEQVVHFLCGRPESPEDVALDAAKMNAHAAHMATILHSESQRAAAAGTSTSTSAAPAGMFDGEVEGVVAEAPADRPLSLPTRGSVSLKMEPFVMHVECRTMEEAKRQLSAAVSDSG